MKGQRRISWWIAGGIAGLFLLFFCGHYVCQENDSAALTHIFSFPEENRKGFQNLYQRECYRYLTDAYFEGRNRQHEYEETGQEREKVYTLVVSLHSSASEEKEWFCSDVINWLLAVTEKLPYEKNEEVYQKIEIAYQGETYTYALSHMQDFSADNISRVYNDLYDFVEALCSENDKAVQGEKEEESAKVQTELSEEMVQWYLAAEPDCRDTTDSGMEYRMIPVDRACGSSYYACVATQDGGRSAAMINTDPYLGSGGAAKWISFLADGKTGFSCLAYSGGTYGSLYRTEDGGRSFEEIAYPSAKAKLSDGTYYNPFVMPEKVYEEEGRLYMEVGQGTDGDYYGKEGFCHGLYESQDKGRTWTYVKEIAVER